MEEAIDFFRAFEPWIYAFLVLVGLYFVRKFILAWQELREAGFGLERDNAQSRLNQSAILLVLLIIMAVSEFVLVSFVAPSLPAASLAPTPNLSLLVTATPTLAPGATQNASGEAGVPELNAGQTIPTAIMGNLAGAEVSGCVPGQIEFIQPQSGQEVSGVVELIGNAAISNFGFYKIETKLPDQTSWSTLQAGNTVIQQGKLADWDTRNISPGEYQIGLVVVDNQARLSPPCVVQVRVVRVPDGTLSP